MNGCFVPSLLSPHLLEVCVCVCVFVFVCVCFGGGIVVNSAGSWCQEGVAPLITHAFCWELLALFLSLTLRRDRTSTPQTVPFHSCVFFSKACARGGEQI